MSTEMEDFHKWFNELKTNSLWWMRMSEMYANKNLNKVAGSVHLYLLASPERLKSGDFADFRRLFQTFASKAEDAPMKPQLQQVETVEVKKEWKPVSEEERGQWLEKWKESIAHLQTVNAVPRIGYKQSIEEGGWLPPKQAPYPCTTTEEAYIRDRHFEYIKRNFEPRTGEKLPDWIPEEEFNKLYDEGLI